MKRQKCTAIVLAAGSGNRMNNKVAKQFLLLNGLPLICYALRAVEESAVIDDCILVTGEKSLSYMREEIVDKHGFHKVTRIVVGGRERYESVFKALQVVDRESYIFIHDGARPFLTEEILEDTYQAVKEYGACVAAVRSKDTVKLSDASDFVIQTPERKNVWNVQTPQVFEGALVIDAYNKLMEKLQGSESGALCVTDDASVVELFSDKQVKLVEGSYRNMKITTPEDLTVAEAILRLG